MAEAGDGSSRRRGRDARRKKRNSFELRFLPEVDRGIPYLDLLTAPQVERIHKETVSLLTSKGIEFRDDESLYIWRKAGADVVNQRVRIDDDLLKHLLSSAPETYTMAARNPERTVTLGGRKQIFTPAYGAPNVIDLDGARRAPTLSDFHEFAKLAHMSPAMHMSGGVVCEPLDIPVPKRHLHMVYSLIRHSDKPFMGMVTARDRAEDTVSMARILFGSEFVEQNTVMTSIANCNSPLVWDQTMLDAIKTYSTANQAVLYTPFVLSGASTPSSTIGSLVQINAEALAGIAFSQAVRPGAPAVYGQWIGAVSMKSGAPMAARPRSVISTSWSAKWRGITNCHGGAAAAAQAPKLVDAQAGYESARNLYGAVLAGANFILSTAGYMEGALSQSFAKFVVDAEQVEMFYKFAKGIDFAELDGALEAMNEVDPGGHYLGTQHTLENFERAFMIPELMHHDSFEQWEAEGCQNTNERACRKVQKMLGEYEAPYLDEATNDALCDFIHRRERELPDTVT